MATVRLKIDWDKNFDVNISASVTHKENWSKVVANVKNLWIADYSASLDPLGYWKSCALWQFTSI